MSLVKDAKKLVDHIMAIALIKTTVNNNKLTNGEKVNKILSHISDLERNLKEVQDEKEKT